MESARSSDPLSSHETVQELTTNTLAQRAVMRVATSFKRPFSDTDLYDKYKMLYSEAPPRNVIARLRRTLEDRGLVERVGMQVGPSHPTKRLLHFVVPSNVNVAEYRAASPMANVEVPKLHHFRLVVDRGEIRLINPHTNRVGPAREQWDLDVLMKQVQLFGLASTAPGKHQDVKETKKRVF